LTDNVKILENLKDAKYFIETFFFINNKEAKTVPFIFNDPQTRFYNFFLKNLFTIIVKARKEGFSSLIEAIWLHACLFFQNEKAVTMAQNQDEMKVHRDRVEFFLQTMGTKNFKFETILDEDSQKELYFPHTKSRYWLGTAGSHTFGRSRDITRFHGTEVAHYEDQSVLTGVLNACIPNAPKIIETTTNGVGELVYRLWEEAGDQKSNSVWKRFFSPWFEDKTNTLTSPKFIILSPSEIKMKKDYNLSNDQIFWYRMKLSEQTEKDKMVQEYPCNAREAFISSGRHFLNMERLDEMEKRCLPPTWIGEVFDDGSTVSFNLNKEGSLFVWKMPRDNEQFLIVADVAEGVVGGCFSVAKVYNTASWECVAQWRDRIDPGLFGKIMVDMGYFFNNATLCPEMNNHGFATLERIKSEMYPHVLNTKTLWPDGSMNKDGFPTNDRTRTLIFSALSNAIEQRTIIEHDITTIREMQKLVKDEKGKVIIENGYMDCAITEAIGAYILKFVKTDETYREVQGRGFSVTSLVSKPKGHAGYR